MHFPHLTASLNCAIREEIKMNFDETTTLKNISYNCFVSGSFNVVHTHKYHKHWLVGGNMRHI